MGLFGSNTKTTVGTSVSRVFEDEQLPNSILQGMTNYLINDTGGDGQMVEQVMESLVGSVATRANRMYKYGQDDYIFGLPSGGVHSSFAGKEASETVLASITGGPVTISYYYYGPLNNLHVGWKKLTEEHGFNYVTNQIESLSTPEVPVFLRDMQVIVTDATLEEASNGSLNQWGTPPNSLPTPEKKYLNPTAGAAQGATSFAVDPSATEDYILVSTCWEVLEDVPGTTVKKPVVKFGEFRISLKEDGYDFLADWHMAKYIDHNSQVGYWLYQEGRGEHPELDTLFNQAYNGNGHFFPFTYLRYGKVSTGADKNSEAYKSTKKLLNKINMDADQLIEGIHDNPDIADVEQAMMIMAIPADTTNEIEQMYLFDFFSGLYEQAQDHINSSFIVQDYGIEEAFRNQINRSGMIIQDKRFKMALNWRNIVKRKVAGTIGAVGTYASGANVVPSSINVPSLDGTVITWDTSTPRHFYQYQVAVGVFEEIQIFELKLTYFIFEQYTTTGDETDEILLIPIDIGIARGYTLAEREILYSRGLHYVFNSRVVTKLKWYQTGVFRAILLIIAIVVTVISYGSTWQTIGAALAAGTITLSVVIMALIQELVKYLIIQLALKLFVREFGAEFAFIVAIVAAIAGSYDAIQAGSINGAPIAKDMLSISTGLTKAIGVQLQDDFQNLLGDYSEFEKYMKDQLQLLEPTEDPFTTNNYLAPLVIFGEKPLDFFQRTVHSGNIGAISMDAVSSYVDVALTLPKLSDTISYT